MIMDFFTEGVFRPGPSMDPRGKERRSRLKVSTCATEKGRDGLHSPACDNRRIDVSRLSYSLSSKWRAGINSGVGGATNPKRSRKDTGCRPGVDTLILAAVECDLQRLRERRSSARGVVA